MMTELQRPTSQVRMFIESMEEDTRTLKVLTCEQAGVNPSQR